jgi:hypothetical protein
MPATKPMIMVQMMLMSALPPILYLDLSNSSAQQISANV